MSEVFTVVKLGGKSFSVGLKYAKKFKGTYLPASQEWVIPGDHTDCVPQFFVSARLVNSPAQTLTPTPEQILDDMDRNPNSIY